MKRLLLIATALLALTSSANAVELPKLLAQQDAEIWCEETLRSDAAATVVRFTGRYADGETCWNPKAQPSGFWIDSRSKFGWGEDSTCTPLRISKARPVRDYELEWTILARCEDHDTRHPTSRNQTFIFNLFKGSLNAITVR